MNANAVRVTHHRALRRLRSVIALEITTAPSPAVINPVTS
jgi:hypothetical protein